MKNTNKKILSTGIKYLAGSLPLALVGPTVIFSAFNNQHHPLYIPVLIFGFLASAAAIFLIFKGIGTIMKSLFD